MIMTSVLSAWLLNLKVIITTMGTVQKTGTKTVMVIHAGLKHLTVTGKICTTVKCVNVMLMVITIGATVNVLSVTRKITA